MVGFGLVAFAVAAAIAKLIGFGPGLAVAGAASLLVTWAGLLVSGEKRLTVSLSTGLLVIAMMFVAWATSGSGVAAGITTGIVMFLSALAARQVGMVKIVGIVAGTLYFLFALLGIVRGLAVEEIAELSAIGCLVGGSILVVLHFVEIGVVHRPISRQISAGNSSSTAPIEASSFFARGPGMRYAIARGVLLGAGMGLYQAHGGSTVFWVMIAIYVVLQPAAEATWSKAFRRAIGTLAGCFAVGAVAQVVSGDLLIYLAFALFVVGLAYYPVNYGVFVATLSFLVVAIYGGGTEQGVIHWALQRVLDNAIGIAIAFVAAYWAFPGRGGTSREASIKTS